MSFAQTLLSIYDELLIYNSNNFFALSLIFGVAIIYFIILFIYLLVQWWDIISHKKLKADRLKYLNTIMRFVIYYKKLNGMFVRAIRVLKKEIFIDE